MCAGFAGGPGRRRKARAGSRRGARRRRRGPQPCAVRQGFRAAHVPRLASWSQGQGPGDRPRPHSRAGPARRKAVAAESTRRRSSAPAAGPAACRALFASRPRGVGSRVPLCGRRLFRWAVLRARPPAGPRTRRTPVSGQDHRPRGLKASAGPTAAYAAARGMIMPHGFVLALLTCGGCGLVPSSSCDLHHTKGIGNRTRPIRTSPPWNACYASDLRECDPAPDGDPATPQVTERSRRTEINFGRRNRYRPTRSRLYLPCHPFTDAWDAGCVPRQPKEFP